MRLAVRIHALTLAGLLGALTPAFAQAEPPPPRAATTLGGHATDALTGAPVPAFSLTVEDAQGEPVGKPRSFRNPEGAWHLEGLPAGELRVVARAKGYAPWLASVSAPEGGERTLDIGFLVARTAHLLVLDDFGRPAQATLTFRTADGAAVPVAAAKGRTASSARADGTGETLVEGLPAAKLTVHVEPQPPYLGQDFALDLRNERQGVLELQLRPPRLSRLRVVVLGAPAEAAPPPAAADVAAWLEDLPAHLAAGRAWPIERDIRIQVLDADGALADAVTLDRLSSKEDLADTLALLPGATRPMLALLTPPRASAVTLSVQAPGYEPATVPLVWPEDGQQLDVLVLLHQRAGAFEPR